MGREPGREKDTDYPVEQLLSKKELRKFKGKAALDKAVIAVLEARQQDRERRMARGEPVPERPDDVGPDRKRRPKRSYHI